MTNAVAGITVTPTVATVNAGDSVAASTFQGLLNICNVLANHTHTWIDDYTLLGTSGGGSGGITSGSLSAHYNRLGGTGSIIANAQVGLVSDGRTFSQQGPTLTYHANWYSPTTAGIIHTYWIRTTVTSGTLTSGGSGVGTWQQISTSADWDVAATSHTTGPTQEDTQSAAGRFDIATDAAGSNIVATWTWSVGSSISN